MLIRDYSESDREAVSDLHARGQTDLNATVPKDLFKDIGAISEAFKGGAFLVAEIDGCLVGIAGLHETGEIVRVAVAKEHRRQGIASALINSLVSRARALGLAAVNLHTLQQQVAAQNLYKSLGFFKTGSGSLYGNRVVYYSRAVDVSPAQQCLAAGPSIRSARFRSLSTALCGKLTK